MELPENCIANILSHTTPVDAGSLSVVSKLFHSAADSDAVWGRFIPSDVVSMFSQSDSQRRSLANFPSKKALYLALSERPIINNEGNMTFQFDRKSGKKCYMVGAKGFSIVWCGDTFQKWKYITLPESRFPKVAQLGDVYELKIIQMMNTLDLSLNTQYAAYLVFKMIEAYGFENLPVKLSVDIVGGETSTKNVYLDPNSEWAQEGRVVGLQGPNVRSDGWLEIEMGVFFNPGIEDQKGQIIDFFLEIKGSNLKRGLIVEGIEVRPKEDY